MTSQASAVLVLQVAIDPGRSRQVLAPGDLIARIEDLALVILAAALAQ